MGTDSLDTARPADIRSARPYVLSRRPLRAFARRLASIVALLVIDVTGIALGLYAALAVRELYYGRTPLWGLLWEAPMDWLPFVGLVTVLVFWRAGLYAERDRRPGFGQVLLSLLLVAVLVVVFAEASGHDFNTYAFAPTALVFSATLVGILRGSYEAVTRDIMRVAGVRRRVVLVGDGEHVDDLHRALGSGRRGIEYDFVGALVSFEEPLSLASLGRLDELEDVLAQHGVDELVVVDSDVEEDRLLEVVDVAQRRGVRVRIAPKTSELLHRRAEFVPGQDVPLFELRPPVFAGTDWAVKRVFDLVIAVVVLVVGLPLWLLIALAVKLDSSGPVLYRSRRAGLHEREFEMIKFRTMYADADERQLELEAANEAGGPLFKIRRDPRMTRVGRVLRRFSIDEIPNLLNVLRGEMSLVGPRPLPIRDFEQLEAWHRKRYLVLPGMTGLWQISGRSDLSFDDLVRLDFYYLETWSVWLDVTILARTLPAVVASRGAY
jgi:exopolysaccharide biosynthesis polyprenyl glycosylphosphotransferase